MAYLVQTPSELTSTRMPGPIVLLTAAVLGALALYGDDLGPVGLGLRHGLGDVLGVGRFAVPIGCAAAGDMSLMRGRQPFLLGCSADNGVANINWNMQASAQCAFESRL